MSVTALKQTIPAQALTAKEAAIVALNITPARKTDWSGAAKGIASTVLPPLVVLTLLLVVWQLACMHKGSSLPPPTQVWAEAYDLIAFPFFDYGSGDIGLAWRVLTSLQRVAIGFGLAAIRGRRRRRADRPVGLGDARAWIRSSRSCAPCRRWPGCRCRSPRSATPTHRPFS